MAYEVLSAGGGVGFNVEHASSLLVYENLFPEICHLNGKGVTDQYTPRASIERVNKIDVMRVLPYAPRFRQLGSSANGAFHNAKNNGYSNAPQSTFYTIPVDLFYDEGVPIADTMVLSNPTEFKAVVLAQLVKTAGLSINIITYAKQIEGFFRVGDNFHKAKTHTKGNIVTGDVTDAELASAVFQYDPSVTGFASNSPTLIFEQANASLDDGIPEIGALQVPREARQAFITSGYNTLMKAQYAQNASEASARILATGWINPFTDSEGKRIDSATGLLGMYDGVDLTLWNKTTRNFVYVALGILGTANDSDADLVSCRQAMDRLAGLIVYGAGTCRGIVGPVVEANPNTYFGGVYILPKMKVGVEVLHGATIKAIVDGGVELASKWGKSTVILLMNKLTFTPIDGSTVTGSVVSGFNTGATN